MKKTVYILLIAAILLSLLTACNAETNGEMTDSTTSAAENGSNTSDPDEQATTGKMTPDLPDVYYDGYEFTILSMNDAVGSWQNEDFFAEKMNGDLINDAKYTRNIYVEDTYGVKITTVPLGYCKMGLGEQAIRKASAAGDFVYDAAVLSAYDACNLVSEGLLRDLNSMAPLDLSKPWWDQKANEDLSIKGKMYFTTGDISLVMSDSIFVMLFNKQLMEDYGLENPYELVKTQKWTYDKLSEMSKAVHADLDGNGEYDVNDLYGLLATDDVMQCIVNSIGEKCAKINSNGDLELSLYNERVLSVVNKYLDFAFDKTVVFSTQRVSDSAAGTAFNNGQGLFFPYGIAAVAGMRALEMEFGILPFPKLDEAQSEYYSPTIAWWSLFNCVPILQEDAERTAVILEALAAESKYTISPAYYDISLKTKNTRDEESSDMLDLIFSTRIYDFGWYYQFGNYNNGIMDLYRNYNKDFTSMYEKNLPKAESDIQEINEKFAEFLV
jgi:hypothetical protein